MDANVCVLIHERNGAITAASCHSLSVEPRRYLGFNNSGPLSCQLTLTLSGRCFLKYVFIRSATSSGIVDCEAWPSPERRKIARCSFRNRIRGKYQRVENIGSLIPNNTPRSCLIFFHVPSIPSTIRRNFDLENSTNGKKYSGIEESTLGKRVVDRRLISSNYESFKQIETSVIFFRTEMSRGFQYNTNHEFTCSSRWWKNCAERDRREENENLVFAIGHYTARGTRSFPRTRANRETWWGGGTRFEGCRGRGKGKKETEVGGSPPLLVTPLYIAHFWLAYMRLFARTSTTKRSHPLRGMKGCRLKGVGGRPAPGYKTK